MCLRESYKKKIWRKKINLYASLKSLRKGVGSGVGPDPDPLVRGTDPQVQIRMRTKMSRIPTLLFSEILRYRTIPLYVCTKTTVPTRIWNPELIILAGSGSHSIFYVVTDPHPGRLKLRNYRSKNSRHFNNLDMYRYAGWYEQKHVLEPSSNKDLFIK